MTNTFWHWDLWLQRGFSGWRFVQPHDGLHEEACDVAASLMAKEMALAYKVVPRSITD